MTSQKINEFEVVIGLEVHCQLATESKIFCACLARLPKGTSTSQVEPNLNTCPVCTAQPGTLPVLNKKVVEYAIRAGHAMQCKINLKSILARKNYFYPDLPKGYQISQYTEPICQHGRLTIEKKDGTLKDILIERIHIEEDAGKSIHSFDSTKINLNRAGVPLIEIVSAPNLRSSEEAGLYLRTLYGIVTALEICDGNLQEGNFRCDVNVSLRPQGSTLLGTRVEIKNINSFRFVEKAVDSEVLRQSQLLRTGKKIIQETRTYDADRNMTESLRVKEDADDYRYFPDPDLMPLILDEAWVQSIKQNLPELPQAKKERYQKQYGLSLYEAQVMTGNPFLSFLFEQCVQKVTHIKTLVHLLLGEVLRLANELQEEENQLRPEHLIECVELLHESQISNLASKQLLAQAWKTGESLTLLVNRLGLKQTSDLTELTAWVNEVLTSNPNQAKELQSGKEKVLGFLVGQVMKKSGGKANPQLVQKVIKEKLGLV